MTPPTKSAVLRPIDARFDVLPACTGSVEYSQGNTKVLCAVTGPSDVAIRNEKIDAATIEVCFVPANLKAQTPHHRYVALVCRDVAEKFVMTTLYPRACIAIRIHEVVDDGCLLSAAINAMALALADASIAMRAMFASVGVATRENAFFVDADATQTAACGDSNALFVCPIDEWKAASLAHTSGVITAQSLCEIAAALEKEVYAPIFDTFRTLLRQKNK